MAPQAFLDDDARDVWACFWRAARRVDDAADDGALPDSWRAALDEDPVAQDDLAAALDALDDDARTPLEARFDAAWHGIRTRHGWDEPPPFVEYVRASALTAGLPLRLYLHLADPDVERPEAVRAADLLGTSVQLGDDVRDTAEDARAGLVTRSAEEPEDAEGWVEQRRALVAWFLAEALRAWPRPTAGRGGASLGPAILWHRAMRDDQIRPSPDPLSFGVDAAVGTRAWYDALEEVSAAAASSPEAARGILRQDLRHRARRLDSRLRALCREAVDGS